MNLTLKPADKYSDVEYQFVDPEGGTFNLNGHSQLIGFQSEFIQAMRNGQKSSRSLKIENFQTYYTITKNSGNSWLITITVRAY